MEAFGNWVGGLGLLERTLIRAGLFVTVLILAWLADFIAKKIVLRIVKAVVKKSKMQWDDVFVTHHVFTRLCHLVPAMVIYSGAFFVFDIESLSFTLMRKASYVYMVLIGVLVVDAIFNSLVEIYNHFEFAKRMSIRSIVQAIKVVLYFLAGVIVLSVVLDKNPSKFIAGMGAMTAVLLLVFKDSILGFVAGIQLSANNMVHVGDWIQMDKYGADGDVIDITLTTVKVQNWDKTISTIPAYALITDSFRNWKGMSQSGGRRIKRSIHIDMNSIKFCTDEMLAKFKGFENIREYIEAKEKEIGEENADKGVDGSNLVDGRRLTNVGTFRAYVAAYLHNHPMVNQNMTFLVRHLDPTPKGLPIQIYVFSKDKVWANYEAIQADIFDHILAVIPQFELRVYQEPAGADFNSEFTIRQMQSD